MIAEMKIVALESVRKSQHKSRAELARESKMQAGIITWIETGRFIPYPSQLNKIAAALGVDDAESLLEQVGEDD